MTTKDDEIIRTRLLLDGEGAGDDRKLTLVLKSFLKVKAIYFYALITVAITQKVEMGSLPGWPRFFRRIFSVIC